MDSDQPLTKEEAAFLAKASTSFLTRMRLEPWVEEAAESEAEAVEKMAPEAESQSDHPDTDAEMSEDMASEDMAS